MMSSNRNNLLLFCESCFHKGGRTNDDGTASYFMIFTLESFVMITNSIPNNHVDVRDYFKEEIFGQRIYKNFAGITARIGPTSMLSAHRKGDDDEWLDTPVDIEYEYFFENLRDMFLSTPQTPTILLVLELSFPVMTEYNYFKLKCPELF